MRKQKLILGDVPRKNFNTYTEPEELEILCQGKFQNMKRRELDSKKVIIKQLFITKIERMDLYKK